MAKTVLVFVPQPLWDRFRLRQWFATRGNNMGPQGQN